MYANPHFRVACLPSVVCCCTLNKTRNCDVYLFDKLAPFIMIIGNARIIYPPWTPKQEIPNEANKS